MISIGQSVKNSVMALLANKARSFLTMLGIIIGVGAVIVIMSVGAGAQSLILSQFKTFGSNLIGVLPGKSDNNGPPTSALGVVITTLTYDDMLALKNKNNVPNLVAVCAYSRGAGTLQWQSASYDTTIAGVSAGYIDVEGGSVADGRFLTPEEEQNLAKVVILGSTVKNELFGESPAVGQRIKIKKLMFEVIGVMEKRGTVAFQDYDDQVFVPVKTMQKLVSGVDYMGQIRAKIDSENNADTALSDVEKTLRERHNIVQADGSQDDFTVRSAAEAIKTITSVTDALKFFLTAMAALSLIVGGVGIMNIMLVTVTERTREIGLRKAIGANSANISNQFLIETIVITTLGGIIGIVGGILISFLISVIAKKLGYDWEFVITLFSILLSIGVSAIVGMIFGLYPARKAARLEPVEALRYE